MSTDALMLVSGGIFTLYSIVWRLRGRHRR